MKTRKITQTGVMLAIASYVMAWTLQAAEYGPFSPQKKNGKATLKVVLQGAAPTLDSEFNAGKALVIKNTSSGADADEPRVLQVKRKKSGAATQWYLKLKQQCVIVYKPGKEQLTITLWKELPDQVMLETRSLDRPIVFSSHRSGNYDIYRMNSDGSGVTQLTTDRADDVSPQWSPDGSCIAFVRNLRVLMLMDPDGGNVRTVINLGTLAGGVRWHPNGSYLIYSKLTQGDWFGPYYRVSTNGSNEALFLAEYGKSCVADFGQNGQSVVWGGSKSNWEPTCEIYTAPIVNNVVAIESATRLTNNGVSDTGPRYSPDFSIVAYQRSYNPNGWGTPVNLHVLDVATMTDRQLTTFSGAVRAAEPAFSSDGSRIVFVYETNGKGDIAVIDTDGTGFVNLTQSEWDDIAPHWRK